MLHDRCTCTWKLYFVCISASLDLWIQTKCRSVTGNHSGSVEQCRHKFKPHEQNATKEKTKLTAECWTEKKVQISNNLTVKHHMYSMCDKV